MKRKTAPNQRGGEEEEKEEEEKEEEEEEKEKEEKEEKEDEEEEGDRSVARRKGEARQAEGSKGYSSDRRPAGCTGQRKEQAGTSFTGWPGYCDCDGAAYTR